MLLAQFPDVRSTDSLTLGFSLIFIGAMVLSILPGSLHQQQPALNIQNSSNFNVSDNPGDSTYPSIATSADNIYVVWQDNYMGQSISHDKKNYDILFTRSTNSGKNFENISQLSSSIELSGRPIVTAFDSNVYVVWIEDTPKEKQIWFRKSTDNGSTFDEPINLGRSDYNRDYIVPKAIAAFGDKVYVVWRHLTEDGRGSSILFRASKDTGNSFGETREISDNAIFTSSPKVSASNNIVYVVWDVTYNDGKKGNKSEGIFFTKTSDDGMTFKKESKLNGSNEFGEAQVVADLNEVYVAWAGSVYNPDQHMKRVFLTISSNNGDTFAEPFLINKGFRDSANVDFAKTEGRLHAVWQARVMGNGEIFHKSSLSIKPLMFGSATNLSNTEGLSECPSVALSGNSTYVVWEDNTYGNHEIFFKKLLSI